MGCKNHVNPSKNQLIVNIFKQRPFEYWRKEAQGAHPYSQNQIPQVNSSWIWFRLMGPFNSKMESFHVVPVNSLAFDR